METKTPRGRRALGKRLPKLIEKLKFEVTFFQIELAGSKCYDSMAKDKVVGDFGAKITEKPM